MSPPASDPPASDPPASKPPASSSTPEEPPEPTEWEEAAASASAAVPARAPTGFHRVLLRGPWELGVGRGPGLQQWFGRRVPFERLWEGGSFARAAEFPEAFALAAGVPGGSLRVRRAFHAPLRRGEGSQAWLVAAEARPELALWLNEEEVPRADPVEFSAEFFAAGEIQAALQTVWEIGSRLNPHNRVEFTAPPAAAPWFAAAWIVFQG